MPCLTPLPMWMCEDKLALHLTGMTKMYTVRTRSNIKNCHIITIV